MNWRICYECESPAEVIIKSKIVPTLRFPVCRSCAIWTIEKHGWELLFDKRKGKELKNGCIAQAAANADTLWLTEATRALYEVSLEEETFINDSVWKLIPVTRENRALGAVFTEAVRMGWIEKTGRVEKSAMVTCNNREKTVWRSLLISGPS